MRYRSAKNTCHIPDVPHILLLSYNQKESPHTPSSLSYYIHRYFLLHGIHPPLSQLFSPSCLLHLEDCLCTFPEILPHRRQQFYDPLTGTSRCCPENMMQHILSKPMDHIHPVPDTLSHAYHHFQLYCH